MIDRKVAWIGSTAVLAHAVVSIAHGYAHQRLGVDLTAWQTAFVAIVISLAPLAAGVLLWTARARLGAILLASAMAGSLVFGAYYHYVAISPDHVAHLPPGEHQEMFRNTAALLVVTELAGTIAALWAVTKSRTSTR